MKIENLTVNYGNIKALKGIDIEVEKNEIVTLIGSNGAGKTTTMNTIAGLKRSSGGRIMFDGEDITQMGTPQIVKKGLTLSPEGRQVFPKLSVFENIELGAYTRSKKREMKCWKWCMTCFQS